MKNLKFEFTIQLVASHFRSMEIPPLSQLELSEPVKKSRCKIAEIICWIFVWLCAITLWFGPALYLASAGFLFTERNYKFEICCARKKTGDVPRSIEEVMFVVSMIFFYAIEIFMGCCMYPQLYTDQIRIFSLSRSIGITGIFILSWIWIFMKLGAISVFYSIAIVFQLLFSGWYYIFKK